MLYACSSAFKWAKLSVDKSKLRDYFFTEENVNFHKITNNFMKLVLTNYFGNFKITANSEIIARCVMNTNNATGWI